MKRGIFQGDAPSPLLFIIALIPPTSILRKAKPGYEFASNGEKISRLQYMDDLKLYTKSEKELDSLVNMVRIFNKDIEMQFGIEKCAVLVMKSGQVMKSDAIMKPDESVIKSAQNDEGYKYLGIPEIAVINKRTRICQLIDVACLADRKVKIQEEEKIEKY